MSNQKNQLPGIAIIATLITAVSGFVIGVFYIYSSSDMEDDSNIPIIQSEETLKEVPIDAKGMKIKDLDKVVYGIVADSAGDDKIERLLPPPETPLEVKDVVDGKQANNSVMVQGLSSTEKKVSVKKRPNKTTTKKKYKPKKYSAKKKSPKATSNKSSWGVQLASVTSKKRAYRIYSKSKKKYSVLKNTSVDIRSVKIKGKRYYRVRAAGYASRSKATTACKIIKTKGGDCIVSAP